VWRGRPARVHLHGFDDAAGKNERESACSKTLTDAARAMISDMPDVEWLRRLCLSLPYATENLQWGETLCFKVRTRLFATVHLAEGKLAPIVLKSSPEKFHELLEIEGISQAPYVGRYQWVMLANTTVLPPIELEALVRQSYDLVAAKAPKKKAPKKKRPNKSGKK
jgi:predicted DNA-binding protein (MmcQ/YjbR family)